MPNKLDLFLISILLSLTSSTAYRLSSLPADTLILPVGAAVKFEANKNYQLDFVTDIGTAWFSGDSYADIWIKDKATDKAVTEVVRTTPPPAPQTISYPIIINNR